MKGLILFWRGERLWRVDCVSRLSRSEVEDAIADASALLDSGELCRYRVYEVVGGDLQPVSVEGVGIDENGIFVGEGD